MRKRSPLVASSKRWTRAMTYTLIAAFAFALLMLLVAAFFHEPHKEVIAAQAKGDLSRLSNAELEAIASVIRARLDGDDNNKDAPNPNAEDTPAPV